MDSLPLELLEEIGDYLNTPRSFEAFCCVFPAVNDDTFYKRKWKINNYDIIYIYVRDDVEIFREVCINANMTAFDFWSEIVRTPTHTYRDLVKLSAITDRQIQCIDGFAEPIKIYKLIWKKMLGNRDVIVDFAGGCLVSNSINILTWLLDNYNTSINDNIVKVLIASFKAGNAPIIDMLFTRCEDGIRVNMDKCLSAVIKQDNLYVFEKCIELEYARDNNNQITNRQTKRDFYINLMGTVLRNDAIQCFTFLMEQPEYNYHILKRQLGKTVILRDISQPRCEHLFSNKLFIESNVEYLEVALKYIDPRPIDFFHTMLYKPVFTNKKVDKMASLLIFHPRFTYKNGWSNRSSILMYYLSHIILRIRNITLRSLSCKTIFKILWVLCYSIFLFIPMFLVLKLPKLLKFIDKISSGLLLISTSSIVYAYLCGITTNVEQRLF